MRPKYANRPLITLIVTAFGLLHAPQALAQTKEALPLWEVGAFATGVSQQAYPGASQNIDRALLLPFFIYRGKFFRADQGTVGLRAFKSESVEVDVGFGGAFGSNSNEIDARKGMPDLGTLVEFGPRVKWKLGSPSVNGRLRAELALRGVFDLTDGFKDNGIALEPELIYEGVLFEGWRTSTALGLVFGDDRLADTFYGVAPVFATATRPAYGASAGLIASRLSVTLSRALSPNLRLFGFARVASVEGSANLASPLVRQNTGSTLGLGITYVIAKSAKSAQE